MTDDAIKRFMSRMEARGDDQPRFNIGYKFMTLDDGSFLEVALFDRSDIIDCERYWLPGNLETDEAINRWGNARMHEFRGEIINVIGDW